MTKFAMAAALLATVTFAAAPASAAKLMGCGGDGMMKVNSMADAMADGPQKMAVEKELDMANTAMSKGDMHGCNTHLMAAQKAGTAKDAGKM